MPENNILQFSALVNNCFISMFVFDTYLSGMDNMVCFRINIILGMSGASSIPAGTKDK